MATKVVSRSRNANCFSSSSIYFVRHFASNYVKGYYVTVSKTEKNSSDVSTTERTVGGHDIFTPSKEFPLPGRVKTNLTFLTKSQAQLEVNKKPLKNHASMQEVLVVPLQRDWQALMVANCIVVSEKLRALKAAMECSVALTYVIHECPQIMRNDLNDLFPGIGHREYRKFSVVIVSRNIDSVSSMELKDMTTAFTNAAQKICLSLKQIGHWAEFLDPSCGRAVVEKLCTSAAIEVDHCYRHREFAIEVVGQTEQVSAVKVVSHRDRGSSEFVGAIFTSAPPTSKGLLRTTGKYLSANEIEWKFNFDLELPKANSPNDGDSSQSFM